jgi:excinuclease ABC subunit A
MASTGNPRPSRTPTPSEGYVRARGVRHHNLKGVDVDIPRDALVVFTGVSGSGKSSLAFGTLYAEAQRRYLESVAAWPGAWQGQNQRDIVTALGIDIDVPWKELPKKDRDWMLFTDETPQIPVWPHYNLEEVKRAKKRNEPHDYLGTFTSARRYVLHTFATSQSALMKRRVARYLVSTDCPVCNGRRLRKEALSVTFAGLDITELSRRPLKSLAVTFRPFVNGTARSLAKLERDHPEKAEVTRRIAGEIEARLAALLDLGLGYLTLDRSTPTVSPGELQRLRLATQIHSNLFGVVYVLDEPSAGLHPADTEALLRALARLKASGNSIFVVEHELDVSRQPTKS